jgi:outer membrane protein, heavy metal efflux system
MFGGKSNFVPFASAAARCRWLFLALTFIAAQANAQQPLALTLQDAMDLTLSSNSELAAAAREVSAIEGRVAQAGVLPNPSLGAGVEDFGNSRLRQQGDRQIGFQVGQLIELGGKRDARIKQAQSDLALAQWDLQTTRLDVIEQVRTRFADVLASQEREALAGETLEVARQFADAVGKRVQAGKVSPVEETRARLAFSSAQVELEQAKRQLVAARQSLSALWNDRNPRFDKAVGELGELVSLPPYEQLLERAQKNPDLARWSDEATRRRADLQAQRARAVPDVTVSAGVARFSEFNDHAYTVGISVPIPLFDQNRGGVLEASRRLDQAEDERRAAEARQLAGLAQIYQRLTAIQNEIETLRTVLLPGAQSAFDAAAKGYQLGKFGFLDVLDAQRTLFQTRSQYLRALADYQRGLSEIERLAGGPLAGEEYK